MEMKKQMKKKRRKVESTQDTNTKINEIENMKFPQERT